MPRSQVLIVEDEPAIRRGVVDALTFAGYAVLEAADGEAGLERAVGGTYDLLLLDLVLPGRGGLDILRAVRGVRPAQPVIILTALGEENDRVQGLRLGADDYVVKPFSVRELLARVEAVLRRAPLRPCEPAVIAIPGGRVHLERAEVCFADGGRCELSEKETELLRYLASHPGRVISRAELLRHIWQLDPRGLATRTIDMHITRLREKLRDPAARPCVLRTVRGRGYLFAAAGTDS